MTDHAQETAMWRVIGEAERAIADLEEELDALQEASVGRPRALMWAGAAFCAGMLAMSMASGGSDRRPAVMDAQRSDAIDITISCPGGFDRICRQISDAARRVAIAILRQPS